VTQPWWVVAFLLGGALVVAWPIGVARRRWTGNVSTSRSSSWSALHARVRPLPIRHPRMVAASVTVVGACSGWAAAGPVAALVSAGYAGLAARALVHRSISRQRSANRARLLDDLCALAADLRAGLPPGPADHSPFGSPVRQPGSVDLPTAGPRPASADEARTAPPDQARIRELTEAVWRLAERTGAPAADLLERIEAELRAADRVRASAAAQAAGARATALLLAGLPVGGIALGFAIGVDPLRVLLHTPLGAACATGTLVLQIGGLAWADRLANAGAPR
jgi:tight adherence protein B